MGCSAAGPDCRVCYTACTTMCDSTRAATSVEATGCKTSCEGCPNACYGSLAAGVRSNEARGIRVELRKLENGHGRAGLRW